MAGEEIIVFWAGAVVFAIAAIGFTLLESRIKTDKWPFRDEAFVSFITVISYVIMANGILTVTAPNGQPIYWTRWLFYIGSCVILATEVARIGGKLRGETLEVAILTGIVMFCGFLASYFTTPERWYYFALSSAAYIGLLMSLVRWRAADQRYRKPIVGFIMAMWSLFPVVWILAPTGFGVISPFTEAILYGILDLVTKIGFGLFVVYRIKNVFATQERREPVKAVPAR
ncbi:hypothetical protein CUJ83_03985 [Methanocella sp. CWC-04]|uniref:Bacteriorhodopsin n=1 Tax=Methanooceanicella nereidis TaxID=2052831 RepID=A0AAP2RB57_9EURY|nr:bacteriorhodopsin [Methanocella sp. CWC-04]MCD1294153.1 hypothetical protein [Methanocella sp. CWC-04]